MVARSSPLDTTAFMVARFPKSFPRQVSTFMASRFPAKNLLEAYPFTVQLFLLQATTFSAAK